MRIFSVGCPALSLLALFNSYSLNAGKPKLAILESILVQFSCPLIMILILFLIRDHNPEEKVEAECCVGIEPDHVYCSISDTGEILNLVDEDEKGSDFRSYIVFRYISRFRQKRHVVSTSFNRNGFEIPRT